MMITLEVTTLKVITVTFIIIIVVGLVAKIAAKVEPKYLQFLAGPSAIHELGCKQLTLTPSRAPTSPVQTRFLVVPAL